ncbi:hypothetical protein ACSBR2_017587 [Camellia fascicularis]
MVASSSSLQDPPKPPSRRLSPPCWSPDETVTLIDAYRDKWYSLKRGNLRASHWQEVADDLSSRCPISIGKSPKTSVQCRHKMEKLRKQYRAEIQRALAMTPKGQRFNSSWVHFDRMDLMEKGPNSVSVMVDSSPIDEDEDDDDYEEDLYQSVKRGVTKNRSVHGSTSNGIGAFRIKIPGRSSVTVVPGTKKSYHNPNPNPNFVSTRVVRDGYSERLGFEKRGGGGSGDGVGIKREGDPVAEMVVAIKGLGDGFMRMERMKMKMEMAREVEAMRREMEMKRTEMILQSQERIVEAFGKALSEKRNKKSKRMPTPEA